MFRVTITAAIATIALTGILADRANAAFTLFGPQTGNVSVNPFFPTGAGPGNTTVATGLISSNNFVTWTIIGAPATDPGTGIPVAGNVLSGPVVSGTAISAVRLVSNSPVNPTLASPAALGSGSLERRTTGWSITGNFTSNEAVLYANAADGALIIDFAVPVSAAGFRVQRDVVSSDSTFFLQAFNETSPGGPYAAASPLFAGNTVNTTTFQPPFGGSAQFYGIEGGNPNETFTRLWIGFGSGARFSISTLEYDPQGNASPVPVPPTIFAAGFGALGLVALRRIRRKI